MPLHKFFFYLTLLLLPTQLGRHFWPEWTLVLGRRIDYLSPTFYLTDLTIILMLMTWFFSLYRSRKGKKLKIKINLKIFFLFVLCVFVMCNCLYSLSPFVSLYMWLKVLEFSLLAHYVIRNPVSFTVLTNILCFPILYSSVIAIIQSCVQHSLGGPLWFIGERAFSVSTPGIAKINFCWFNGTFCREVLRPYATFPHPNVLAGFLASLVPLLVLTVLQKQTLGKKIVMVSSLIVSFIALLLTASRAAIIVGTGGLVITVLFSFKRSYKKGAVIASLLLIISVFMVTPYFQELTPGSESVSVRKNLNNAAFTLSRDRPLVGTGLGTFIVALPQVDGSRNLYFLQPVHNIYLLILSETGIFGLFLFLLVIFLNMKRPSFNGSHVPFVILLILGLFDHYSMTLQQ